MLELRLTPDHLEVGVRTNGHLCLTNRSPSRLSLIRLAFRAPSGVRLLRGQTTLDIPRLEPGETVQVPLVVEGVAPGSFALEQLNLSFRDPQGQTQRFDGQAPRWLVRQPAPRPSPSGSPVQTADPTLEVSPAPKETLLNKYRILELIGQGGMARVWLAEEITFGGRRVVLKEPRDDLSPDDLQEVQRRYRQEVRICAALTQAGAPNIVRAITAEPYGEGVLLVAEHMPGGDLAALLAQHPDGLPVEQAVAIALDVLRALQGVHEHPLEIVHRDVKPSNILFDSQGRAHLADFGLAQTAGTDGGPTQLTGDPHPGTPLYMAPEQERGGGYLTPAADLYALGCVLFEMLTGQRYKRVRPGTPAGRLRAGLPAELDQVLAKALAEEPWDR